MKKRLAALLLILAFAASSLTGCVKVVKIGEEGKLTGEVAFNADSDVESIWQSKAVPELTEKAVDLNTFLTESKGDLKTLADQYGKYSMGTSGELNYVVKGTAEVVKVDQTKKAGVMDVKLQGYDGPETIQLQIGSVFKGSAVRDSLNFIKYEDYKNQVQWANVSQSIHTVIQKQVLDPLNVASLTGKTVEFVGCFTVDGNDKLLITPVQMTVK
ncbi:MAG: DUF2291 domain-containing protein [Clostridium sp.]|nr:DUF2291 domain-containing protein [Clostridium sp.]